MAQSLSKIYIHLIFSTKNRQPLINAEWQTDLWAYMAGAIAGQKCYANKIGGVSDHIHILCELHRTVTLSNLVKEIKSESTKWIKHERSMTTFSWQAGYGAFSVSASNVVEVIRYIENQAAHHKNLSFQDEFRSFLKKYHVEYDEKYVWD